MHFLDAWRELSGLDLARLAIPAGFLALATFLPGRRIALFAAIGIAISLPFLRELGAGPWVAAGWTLLWLAIAASIRNADEGANRPLGARGMLEVGTIGLLLNLVLVALLIGAVARQDMSPEDARRASYGVLFLGFGLLHLMLRRHARRAAVAFAALGLGLQVLDGAARAAQVGARPSTQAAVLIMTALAVTLALRIAAGRERFAGTAWVSDAHDLHD